MKLEGRWPALVMLAGCAGLLLVLIGWLMARSGDSKLPARLVLGKSPEVTAARFDEGFGRLDALVPFRGGIAQAPAQAQAEGLAPEYRDEAWLRSRHPESYTLQLLAAREESTVVRFLASREDRGELLYFSYPDNGERWFVVVVGEYPSRELAQGVAETMPAVADSRPFPRRFGAYQALLPALSAD
ncbi:MAG: SPOR domain-containing protein [Moraxellaceae bacterium]